jgi:hypothetical protein
MTGFLPFLRSFEVGVVHSGPVDVNAAHGPSRSH